MEKTIVLLRGVNVGGNRKLPMAELRNACRAAGLIDIETYIQSGNLVLSAASAEAAETHVEDIILRTFGFAVEAIARSRTQWAGYAARSPFADADARGAMVHLGLSKAPPRDGIVAALAARARHGEVIIVDGDAIWIDYREGVGDSKITPAAIDKAAGSTVTMRNWRTVVKLAEIAAA